MILTLKMQRQLYTNVKYLFINRVNKKNFEPNSNYTLAIMSSTAGYKGLPNLFYTDLKKWFVNLIAIKSEMHDNLNVKFICPGFVETPATKVNSFKMPFNVTKMQLGLFIKGFEISFLFLLIYNETGKVLPYKLYFKITEKKFSKNENIYP